MQCAQIRRRYGKRQNIVSETFFHVLVGGFLTMMYLHAVSVEKHLMHFVGSITVDSVDVYTAHSAVNKRSFILLVNIITVLVIFL